LEKNRVAPQARECRALLQEGVLQALLQEGVLQALLQEGISPYQRLSVI
jgi:hypothetical protein